MKAFTVATVALLAIGLAGCGTTSAPPPVSATAPPAITLRPVETKPAGVGDVVDNGSLEFVVHGVRREEQLRDQYGIEYSQAGAEFVIVSMSVRNTSGAAVFFYPTSQILVVQGTQVEPDQNAIGALDANPGDIQPGLTVNLEMPFLVPIGTQPEAIMVADALHAISSPGSPATRVNLS